MMLTEKETKLIKTYCVLPVISLSAFVTVLLISGVWFVLEMIDGVIFNSQSFFSMGLYIYLALVIILLAVILYGLCRPRFGMRGQVWKDLAQKINASQSESDFHGQVAVSLGLSGAGRLMERSGNKMIKNAGAASEAAGAALGAAAVADMSIEMMRNAKTIAQVCQIPVPKARKYILPIVLLPVLILIGIYILEFSNSSSAMNTAQETAAASVGEVVSALENGCARVSYDDPTERYKGTHYSVLGYLYGSEAEEESIVFVNVGNDGVIQSVSYIIDVDVKQSQEDNLNRAASDISLLHDILSQADVAAPEGLLDDYEIPEEFTEAFLAGTAYEECSGSAMVGNVRVYASYDTDSEEDYDEYSRSNIYMGIEAR